MFAVARWQFGGQWQYFRQTSLRSPRNRFEVKQNGILLRNLVAELPSDLLAACVMVRKSNVFCILILRDWNTSKESVIDS